MPRASAAPGLETLHPMLLTERKAVPREAGWLYEIKFDGYRVLASTGPGGRLKSRGSIDASSWFPEVVAALADMPTGTVLDGKVGAAGAVQAVAPLSRDIHSPPLFRTLPIPALPRMRRNFRFGRPANERAFFYPGSTRAVWPMLQFSI